MGVATTTPEISSEVTSLVLTVRSLRITTPDEMIAAGDLLQRIEGAIKKGHELFDPGVNAAYQAHKKACELRDKVIGPLEKECKPGVKRAMILYQQQEREKAQAEQRRLQAEADAKAERERQAMVKKAEAAKRESTKAKYQEAAREIAAPAVLVPSAAPRPAGFRTRKVWKCRVVDDAAVPREYCIPDTKKLDALAKALKEGAKVPGCEFYFEDV